MKERVFQFQFRHQVRKWHRDRDRVKSMSTTSQEMNSVGGCMGNEKSRSTRWARACGIMQPAICLSRFGKHLFHKDLAFAALSYAGTTRQAAHKWIESHDFGILVNRSTILAHRYRISTREVMHARNDLHAARESGQFFKAFMIDSTTTGGYRR